MQNQELMQHEQIKLSFNIVAPESPRESICKVEMQE